MGCFMYPMMNIAIEIARKAGRMILNAHDNMYNVKIKYKSHHNYVTNIDLEIEKFIVNILKKYFVDQYYITEESGTFGNKNSDYTWIIDPIDGTTNFIHRIPHHCVSIAMKFKGNTKIAVIYNPYQDQLFSAFKGSGAQLNGKRIRVAQHKDLSGSLLSGTILYNKNIFSYSYKDAIFNLQKEILGLRYSGSLALDMCYVATGYLDAVWTSRKTNIWDTIGASLIINEAGGMICSLDGGLDYLDHGMLIGGNPKIVSKLVNFFYPHLLRKE